MKSITIEKIKEYFPQLDKIQDRKLAEAACQIWVEAFEKSSWENIEDAQFATRAPGVALVKHTENVTDNAIMVANNVKKKY